MDEDSESLLTKFADGIVVAGVKISLQTVGMAKTNKVKFNRNRVKVLYLGLKKNPLCRYRLGIPGLKVIHTKKNP